MEYKRKFVLREGTPRFLKKKEYQYLNLLSGGASRVNFHWFRRFANFLFRKTLKKKE